MKGKFLKQLLLDLSEGHFEGDGNEGNLAEGEIVELSL
jgi:hypothetical protein